VTIVDSSTEDDEDEQPNKKMKLSRLDWSIISDVHIFLCYMCVSEWRLRYCLLRLQYSYITMRT
jgi:hypothetical protein